MPREGLYDALLSSTFVRGIYVCFARFQCVDTVNTLEYVLELMPLLPSSECQIVVKSERSVYKYVALLSSPLEEGVL